MDLLSRLSTSARSQAPGSFAVIRQASGIHWTIELLALFSMVLVAAGATVGLSQLESISPHPYWIPVLLLACQHGAAAGVAAAATASTLHWYHGMTLPTGGEDLYDYLYRISREPMLWLGAAIVMGGFRAQQAEKTEALQRHLVESDAKLASIGKLAADLRRHCEALERHIACSADRSFEAGLSVLETIHKAAPEQLPVALPRAIDVLIGPASYTVLTLKEGRLIADPALTRIQHDARGMPRIETLPHSIETEFMRGRRLLTIRESADLERLAGLALIAASIASPSPAGERHVGALLIQTMDPLRLTPEVERSICMLCTELGHAFGRDRMVIRLLRERPHSRDVHEARGTAAE